MTASTANGWADGHDGQMSQHLAYLAVHTVKRSGEAGFFDVKPDSSGHVVCSPALAHYHFQPAARGSAMRAPMMSAGLCDGDAAPRRRSSWPAPYCEALQRGRRASRRICGEGEGVLERRRLAVRALKSAAGGDAWRACRPILFGHSANVIETRHPDSTLYYFTPTPRYNLNFTANTVDRYHLLIHSQARRVKEKELGSGKGSTVRTTQPCSTSLRNTTATSKQHTHCARASTEKSGNAGVAKCRTTLPVRSLNLGQA